ncbi:MAG: terminase [Planctomyces sp.]|nr:terminase [Planctomyces sp.]
MFRQGVLLEPRQGRPAADRLQPWQRRDFAVLDPAWRALAGRASPNAVVPLIRRAYFERPRGHSKTTDTALQLAWVLLAARHSVHGLAAAADRDQAGFLKQAIERIVVASAPLLEDLEILDQQVRHRGTGSQLKVISSDVRSSWGELPDFVVCDELCHWRTSGLWESLLSSAAKRPECVLLVLSNAGTGRGWQWDVREAARTDPAWHFSSLSGPQAPWITAEALDEQRRLLPPGVFARLWLNEWQHSDGEFVTLDEARACCDPQLAVRESGAAGQRPVAAIDYAEKRDLTVGCVCRLEQGVVIVDRMDVVRPAPDRATPVQWVEDWMRDMAARFPGIRFVIDEYQLAGTAQRLGGQHDVQRFAFSAGRGNCELASVLRQLILSRRVRWPPGCGTIPGEEGRVPPDDLEAELASLIVREQAGRFRFLNRGDGRHHDDRSFALGVACLELLKSDGDAPRFEITPPADAWAGWGG